MATGFRTTSYEIWSCSGDGNVERHGRALGITFEDACKQLASESVDFWTHFDKGTYRGRRLYPSRAEALAGSEMPDKSKTSAKS
jgi:hypothetical protein